MAELVDRLRASPQDSSPIRARMAELVDRLRASTARLGGGGGGRSSFGSNASSTTVRLGHVQPQAPGHRTIVINDPDANLAVQFKVEYIFSDKTGTLTRNLMEFFKCSIGGEVYGTGISEIERGGAQRNGFKTDEVKQSSRAAHEKGFNFDDARLMRGAWRNERDPESCKEFFRCLAICHTVLPEGDESPEKIRYQAASPDEAALVVAAKIFGFFFYRIQRLFFPYDYQIVQEIHRNDPRESSREELLQISNHLTPDEARSYAIAKLPRETSKHTGFAFDSPGYESFFASQQGVFAPQKAWDVVRRASMRSQTRSPKQ